MSTPNYSLDDLPARAAQAKNRWKDYLRTWLHEFEGRRLVLKQAGIPAVAFCGMGRAGKDTAAEYLCAQLDIKYPKSASWLISPLVAEMAEIPAEVAWETRHQNREFWIHACHALRGKDYGMLVRMCLGAGDVAVGIRGRFELDRVLNDGTIDLAVWIDNPRVPKDPTVEYGPEDCDLVIPNHGSLLEFYRKLRNVAKILKR